MCETRVSVLQQRAEPAHVALGRGCAIHDHSRAGMRPARTEYRSRRRHAWPSKLLPGKPFPLGATWDGKGTNFAIFSENATRVDLCFFASESDRGESERVRLQEVTGHVWHGYLPEVGPVSCMATESTGHTIRRTAFASTRTSSSSIRMPTRSRGQ